MSWSFFHNPKRITLSSTHRTSILSFWNCIIFFGVYLSLLDSTRHGLFQEILNFFFFFSLFIYLAAHGLSCACGIWFPNQVLNPGPQHWEFRVLASGPPGESLTFLIICWCPLIIWCSFAENRHLGEWMEGLPTICSVLLFVWVYLSQKVNGF